MTKTYVTNTKILQYIDSLTLRTLFIKMKILDKDEHVLSTIEGHATGGSISINASSAVRRTGSITLVTGDSSYEEDQELQFYKVTEIDNLISMNKLVAIEIGLKNTGLEYPEYDIFWIPLGQFLITNASVTHSTQGIQIQAKLTDKMALLNGDIGGVIPGTIIHSPIEDLATGEKFQALFFILIKELVSEIGEIPENKIIIEDISERIATPVFWKNLSTTENVSLVGYQKNGTTVYEIKKDNKVYSNPIIYEENQKVGMINTDFVYPQKELSSSNGSTVVSMLDKIAKELGNFEYFFDLDGNFRFREIKNYLNEGSEVDDLTLAIADGYFINTSKGKSIYSFKEGVNLVSSYSNNPSYSNIKNDYTVWGKKRGSDTAIRYHLIIDNKRLTQEEENRIFKEDKTDGSKYFDVWLATVDSVTRAYCTESAARYAVSHRTEDLEEEKGQTIATVETFGRWCFKDTIIPYLTNSLSSKYVPFKLQGAVDREFAALRYETTETGELTIYYTELVNDNYTSVKVYSTTDGWVDNIYKSITFGASNVSIPEHFYNWLSANASYQEQFTTEGIFKWEEVSLSTQNISQSIEFYLYTVGTNFDKSKAVAYDGIIIDNGTLYYTQRGANIKVGGWYEGNFIWDNNKYKIIYITKSHISDIFSTWFKASGSMSIEIFGKWEFNNILNFSSEFNSLNYKEIPLNFTFFDSQSGTQNPYLNDRYSNIKFDNDKQAIYAYNSYSNKVEAMYENNQWKEVQGRTSSDPVKSFQYIKLLTSQLVPENFYNWLLQNATSANKAKKVQINGLWELKTTRSFSPPSGYYDFNVVNRSESVAFTAYCSILNAQKQVQYEIQNFIIKTVYNSSTGQKMGPSLQVQFPVNNSLRTMSWLEYIGNTCYHWQSAWKYVDFGLNSEVSEYFYIWFTANFKPAEEATTFSMVRNSEPITTFIKEGEIWQLKSKFTLPTTEVSFGDGSIIGRFFDVVSKREFDKQYDLEDILYISVQKDIEDDTNYKLLINSNELYTTKNGWKIAPPIAVKFLVPVTDESFYNIWNVIAVKQSIVDSTAIAKGVTIDKETFDTFDWRLQRYYYYLLTQDTSYLGKELMEKIPQIINVQTGNWKSTNLLNCEYYIDMIDINDVEITNDTTLIGTIDKATGKKYVSTSGYDALSTAYEFAVHKVQRRATAINSQEVNCLFRTGTQQNQNSNIQWENSVFILNKNDPKLNEKEIKQAQELEAEAQRNGQTQVIVSKDVFDRLSVLDEETSAYDLLRAQLHEFLSYNANINLTTVPIYHLDVNTRISVEDEKSDIHGDYIIQSIQIPLTINGNMTINAKRAIERI